MIFTFFDLVQKIQRGNTKAWQKKKKMCWIKNICGNILPMKQTKTALNRHGLYLIMNIVTVITFFYALNKYKEDIYSAPGK